MNNFIAHAVAAITVVGIAAWTIFSPRTVVFCLSLAAGLFVAGIIAGGIYIAVARFVQDWLDEISFRRRIAKERAQKQ